MKKQLSDRETLLAGFESRIKFKKQQLAKTKVFHREVEAGITKKIHLYEIQAAALRKSKV